MTKAERLGLRVDDFRDFLVTTGRISEKDKCVSGDRISILMNNDALWKEYEKMAETRASARESGRLDNGGQNNANEKRRDHVE